MSFSDENVACTRNASIDEASPVTEQSRTCLLENT